MYKKIIFFCNLLAVAWLFFGFLAAGNLSAEYYRYTDKNGNLRFTDNLADVPEDQRKKVKAFQEIQSPPAPLPQENAASGRKDTTSDTDQTTYDAGIRAKAKELDTMKAELDAMFEELQKERNALDKEKPGPNATREEIKAYNEKVRELNAKIEQYRKKRDEFKQKVNEYNAALGR